MKKILLLTVVIGILCAVTGTAAAEQPRLMPTVEMTAVGMGPVAEINSFRVYTRTATQPLTRTITVYQEQPNGSYDDGTPYPVKIVTATYEYKVYYDLATKKFIGGVVSKDGYPQVKPVKNVSSDLAVTAVHTQDYSNAYVSAPNGGNNFKVYIVGGYATITYNSELWRHLDGTITPGGNTSVDIGYYLNITGDLESLKEN